MNRYVRKLTRLAESYRDAEAQIVRAYFKKPRTRRDHLRWLKAQGFKEYSAIKPILTALNKLYEDIDHGIDRHDYEELIEKLADETKHARLVMDLLQEIGGKKVEARDLTWLPEDRKLAKTRARYSKSYAALLHGSEANIGKEIRRKDEDLERAAITLTEGGGGALYQVCSGLKKRGIERKIARVFSAIHRDELNHKDAGGRSLANLIKTKDAYRRAVHIICEISRQRLRMRNEQFGFPLAESDVDALDIAVNRNLAGKYLHKVKFIYGAW